MLPMLLFLFLTVASVPLFLHVAVASMLLLLTLASVLLSAFTVVAVRWLAAAYHRHGAGLQRHQDSMPIATESRAGRTSTTQLVIGTGRGRADGTSTTPSQETSRDGPSQLVI